VSAGFAGLVTDGMQCIYRCDVDVMLCWCDVVGSVVAFSSDCQQVPIPVNVLVAAEQDRISHIRKRHVSGKDILADLYDKSFSE
jgi:hypothetical protein